MEAEKKRKDQQKLLSYEELPDYMKENEYIRYHYRAEWPIRNALLSLFSWHNETLNIWTAANLNLIYCSGCHLLCCHSHRLNLFLLRMDYVGIAVMIVTSFFPPIYYIFQCDPHWQVTYLVAISAMGFVTVFTLLSPQLSTGEFRAYRALLFAGMGLSGIVPAVHAAVVNWGETRRNVTLAYETAMATSYLTGTIFYVTRVPERWKPGWFDLAGHSHQIFHAFVIAGAVAHYGAAVIFLQWRDKVGCGGAP
ncbi:hypothetical protein GW17_00032567 [Ensete ventricosum]|nr:hypothetical protein GW17_00032567 [Ensete ventricosum]